MAPLLASSFRELEPFVPKWSLAAYSERFLERTRSSMSELRAFYDAMLPRLAEAIQYLNGFPLDAMTPEAKRLLNLCLSLMEVCQSVELWNRPDQVRAVDPKRIHFWDEQRPQA